MSVQAGLLPVFALVAFAMPTRKDDLLFVVMSRLIVISRYAHAFVGEVRAGCIRA